MIAVLTDVKTPNFEEVVKQMMLGDNEKYFKALDDNGLTDKFWELCENSLDINLKSRTWMICPLV